MKSKSLIYLEKALRFMAKAVLLRHKPKIIAITGSVGKTSTKAAVFAVLSAKFSVWENQKNYNNEIGIPLTIIGAESGGKNLFKWLGVLLKWVVTLIMPGYPEFLVLELGVDRPGDMKYFMSFIQPQVGIMTNISLSHIEFFKTMENIAKEKRVLIESLPKDGWAVLNLDDQRLAQLTTHTKAQVLTFGENEEAQINAAGIVYNYENEKPEGLSFKLNYAGKNIPIRLRNVLAAHQVPAALAAIGVGIIFKINLVDIASSLEHLSSPTGRMNLLEGENGSFLIDDTYNASPTSTLAALEVLAAAKAKRKIVALGDMLELGEQSEAGHVQVLEKVFALNPALVVLVGDRMRKACEQLAKVDSEENKIWQFADPTMAAEKLKGFLQAGDFVLIKGSQGMRMEKIVAEILQNPNEAKNLLCRQNDEWLKKPFIKP